MQGDSEKKRGSSHKASKERERERKRQKETFFGHEFRTALQKWDFILSRKRTRLQIHYLTRRRQLEFHF